MFIGFINFYQYFIQGFSKIFVPLTSLLKRIVLSNSVSKMFSANNNTFVNSSSKRANDIVINLSKNNKSKKLTYLPNIGATKKSNFITPNTKKTFNHLQLAFIKALILQYFDLENLI